MNSQELFHEIERRLRPKIDRELDRFIRGMVADDVYAPEPNTEYASRVRVADGWGPWMNLQELDPDKLYIRTLEGPEDGILSAGAVRAEIKTLRVYVNLQADAQAARITRAIDRITQLEQGGSGEGTKLCALEIMSDMDDSIQDAVAGFKARIASLEAWRSEWR